MVLGGLYKLKDPTSQQGEYMAKKRSRKTARKSAKTKTVKRARARRSKKAAR